MSAITKATFTAEDIEKIPSRLLHSLFIGGRHPPKSKDTAQGSHVDPPVIARDTATQRVLCEEALLFIIMQWLVVQDTLDVGHFQEPKTTNHLLSAALTCVAWFHPSMSWAWHNLQDARRLVHLLLPENLRGFQVPESVQYRYICQTYYADPSRGRLHPQFLNFRYYSGLVHMIRVTATDFVSPVFSMLGRLHDSNVLLPALRSLAWSDTTGDVSPIAFRTFGLICRAPYLTSLVISLTNPFHLTAPQWLATLSHLQTLLRRAVHHAPRLTALTIVGPLEVPLFSHHLSRFPNVRHMNLQINVRVPAQHPGLWVPPAIADYDDHRLPLETVFLCWTVRSNILSILHPCRFSNLTSLTVMADDHPPLRFLEQVRLLGGYVAPCLKNLHVEAGIQVPIVIEGMLFAAFIQPFLRISTMERVSIVLPSLRLRFRALDLQMMLRAWPALSFLHIGFVTQASRFLPDLRSVIASARRHCPNLTKLHLPGIGTFKSEADTIMFSLPKPTTLHTFDISSGIMFLEHHPLDVAYWMAKTFARNPVYRPWLSIGGSWRTIADFIDAIKAKDTDAVLNTVVSSWPFPPPEWVYMVSNFQERCLREMELNV